MSIGAGQVTRFGIGGGIWQPLDTTLFANKEEGVATPPPDPNPAQREAVAGGALGRSNRRKRLIARDNEDLLDIIKAAMPEIAKYL